MKRYSEWDTLLAKCSSSLKSAKGFGLLTFVKTLVVEATSEQLKSFQYAKDIRRSDCDQYGIVNIRAEPIN